jgi:L-aspartate oxidase
VAGSTDVEPVIAKIQDLMWRDVGIVRIGTGLRRGIAELEQLRPQLATAPTRRCCEARNLLQAGLLIAKSALAREESRGAHYRMDYPTHNDAKFAKHSVVCGDSIRFV